MQTADTLALVVCLIPYTFVLWATTIAILKGHGDD